MKRGHRRSPNKVHESKSVIGEANNFHIIGELEICDGSIAHVKESIHPPLGPSRPSRLLAIIASEHAADSFLAVGRASCLLGT